MTEEEIERHNALYAQAWQLVEGQLALSGPSGPGPVSSDSERLRSAASLFRQALGLAPSNWPALWALGKIHQRLGEYSEALAYFSRAFAIEPRQVDVAREAGITATQMGDSASALRYCKAAVELDPADVGLVGNLALAFLIDGNVEQAQALTADACRRDPVDAANQVVRRLVESVAAGARPLPKSGSDLGLGL